MRNLLVVLWCGILAGSARSAVLLAQTPAAPAPADPVTLIAGDSVRITVWRRPEFSGDFIVNPDGAISHPLYRTVRVGGIPFTTAESNLRTFLARFEQDPQFVMEPLVRVSVSGEVGRPQVFAVRPETTVLKGS